MPDDRQQKAELDHGGELLDATNTGAAFTVVLISPDDARRRTLVRELAEQHAKVLVEFNSYPGPAHLDSLAEVDCDAYIIEIDSDLDLSLELVEAVCSRKPAATVMVYSDTQDAHRVMTCMRAGAREFLVAGSGGSFLRDALVRAALRRTEQQVKKTVGSVMVFWGAKGGSGVTTVAANFAVALRQESGAEVVLVDLNPVLGDAALSLGLTPRFTILDALSNPKRIDREFVSSLMVKHDSGVSVIGAPDKYLSDSSFEPRAVARLLDTLRANYAYVIVDAGPGLGSAAESVLRMASTFFLVTQLDIVSLRNAQRILSHVQELNDAKIELVINRCDARRDEFDLDAVTKALGRAPSWRIPNDYMSACRASNTGAPLIDKKSGIAQMLRQMARDACGKKQEPSRRKSWAIFG